MDVDRFELRRRLIWNETSICAISRYGNGLRILTIRRGTVLTDQERREKAIYREKAPYTLYTLEFGTELKEELITFGDYVPYCGSPFSRDPADSIRGDRILVTKAMQTMHWPRIPYDWTTSSRPFGEPKKAIVRKKPEIEPKSSPGAQKKPISYFEEPDYIIGVFDISTGRTKQTGYGKVRWIPTGETLFEASYGIRWATEKEADNLKLKRPWVFPYPMLLCTHNAVTETGDEVLCIEDF